MQRDPGFPRARASGITQRANDGVRAIARRAALVSCDDLVMVAVERGDHRADMRATEVDAEVVLVAQTRGSLPASSGEDSALASPSMTLFCAAL